MYECINKSTGGVYAVKVIDKNAIMVEEKELIQNEIKGILWLLQV